MSFVQIVVLAGGTGGARFLRGVRAAAPEAEITAVVNTGDDVTMHGLRICPDLDTVVYTLGGGIDEERGWGRAGESWTVKEELAAYGADPDWFGLGDRDLATHLIRTRMLDAGYPLSAVTAALADRWQPGVTVLPMSDQRVETHVVVTDPETGRQRAIHFQEWWVRHRAAPRSAVLRPGRGGRRPAGARRGRGLRRRRRRAAGAVQPGGLDRHDPRRARPARGAAAPPRPASPASRRSSAAPSCAAWPTAACPCSASRSAPRGSAGTTAPAAPAACSTPGWWPRTTRRTCPGVDVRQVPLLMSSPEATAALARAALDAAGV